MQHFKKMPCSRVVSHPSVGCDSPRNAGHANDSPSESRLDTGEDGALDGGGDSSGGVSDARNHLQPKQAILIPHRASAAAAAAASDIFIR